MHIDNGIWDFLDPKYPCPISLNGRTYTCVESAYQAAKSTNPRDWDIVSRMPGIQAMYWGKAIKPSKAWEKNKIRIMRKALTAKFEQNKNMMHRLFATPANIVIENDDPYWGVTADGKGENRLGLLMMQIREDYRAYLKQKGLLEELISKTRLPI